jgi:hypothetical protein
MIVGRSVAVNTILMVLTIVAFGRAIELIIVRSTMVVVI